MKDCNCNNPTPGFIPVPAKPAGSCRPKACEYTKIYYLPANLGTDAPDQPYAPKPGAYHDAFVVYEANGAIYYYDAMGVPLHIAGGGVTSVNGQIGEVILGTIKILMNGELQGAYNGEQSIEIDLPIPVLGEIATGNTGYVTGDMIHTLQAALYLALANETGAREEGDQALSTGLQAEATARKQADDAIRELITNQGSELQANITKNTNAISDLATKEANDVTSLDSRVTKNATDIIGINTRVTAHDQDIASLKTSTTTLQSDLTNLTNTVNTNNDNLDQTVQRDTTVVADASTITITKTTGNIKNNTSAATDIALPVASDTSAGVLNAAGYQAIQNNAEMIDSILGGAVLLSTVPANPTQDELTNLWKTATGKDELINRASIYDSANKIIWYYYENANEWEPASISETATVSQATNDALGIVKGSTTNGQIAVEPDGTMSLNGYDALVAKGDSLQGAVDSLQAQVGSSTTDVTGLTTQVNKNTSDIENLQTSVASNTNNIATLQTNMATNTSDLATHSTTLATHSEDINQLNQDVASNTNTIAALQSDVATNTSSITTLNSGKQDVLVSGVNIKTINNASVLGSGNIAVATQDELDELHTEFVTALGTANANLSALIDGAGV